MLLLSVLFNNRLILNFLEVFVRKGGRFDEFLTTLKFFLSRVLGGRDNFLYIFFLFTFYSSLFHFITTNKMILIFIGHFLSDSLFIFSCRQTSALTRMGVSSIFSSLQHTFMIYHITTISVQKLVIFSYFLLLLIS